jgi:hypothetical protein
MAEINTGLGWKAGRRFTKQMALKTGRSSNTCIRQSRLQRYFGQMKQRRSLHTNKKGNKSKGNNNNQPICTQFHQTYIKGLIKAHINSNTVVTVFYIHLSPIEKSSRPKNQQGNPRHKWPHRSKWCL